MFYVYRIVEADGDIPGYVEMLATCAEEGWANDIMVLLSHEFQDWTFGYSKITENPFKDGKNPFENITK